MNQTEVASALRGAGCVWAEEEAGLLIESATSDEDLARRTRRRAGGEPLELVLGWAAFRGLRIGVEPGVFIPRRRTELLAGQAVRHASRAPAPVVVELCCGAAAISCAVLHEAPGPVELHAADIDPAAAACARRNLGGRGQVHTGDLFTALPARLRGRVDVLVANVPYVPTAELEFLPGEARDFDPAHTLDGGDDGLTVYRRLIDGAAGWLAPGGQVMCEISRAQLPAAVGHMITHGLIAETRHDEEIEARVVIGTRPAPAPR
ncbi:putative protein N(5)-glutamine methyltransferase [Kineosporia corallincola]|uniref:putative protein N(5)-glutamine methyltransferase n=1 Tax=Kineosporia corallincola TaxID=2835133 RepID=UPI0027E0591F|nr:putative protein N(5)-glutamine methyltransferase [Kineosporia corallincola]